MKIMPTKSVNTKISQKQVVLGLLILSLMLLATGCVNYKAYDLPQNKQEEVADTSLVDEIAKIEKELDAENKETEEKLNETQTSPNETETEEIVEEVILPELTDNNSNETLPVAAESDLQIITVKENEQVKLNVSIKDPDEDPVTYSFTKPLDKNGQWKTKYGDAGEYIVTLTATDGKLTTTKKLKIVVERVNVPPVIEKLGDLTVREGQVVNFQPKVTDPNNDPVTVTISEPLATGKWQTDHTSAGVYKLKVMATDGELKAESSITLTVENVNVLPEISNVENLLEVKEGDVVKLQPKVFDLDEDEVKLSISSPVGDDGVWEIGFTENGEYEVSIVADDGKDKVTKKVKIIVEDVNMPPEIVDIRLG